MQQEADQEKQQKQSLADCELADVEPAKREDRKHQRDFKPTLGVTPQDLTIYWNSDASCQQRHNQSRRLDRRYEQRKQSYDNWIKRKVYDCARIRINGEMACQINIRRPVLKRCDLGDRQAQHTAGHYERS